MSFTAHPGQSVAISDSTDSGKSSLINLIPCFYDVRHARYSSMELTFTNGLNPAIECPSRAYLRKIHCSIEPLPPTSPLAKTLNISTHHVLESAQTAVVTDFIAIKKDGFASAVAQDGSNFSGGQKQRLFW
ncbi:MAG: hypothetical protein Q3974_08315 [Rothia sp. (in: high G+C Gram-positive bacteria)]|nr:hypothetical protein [Rothia sp. (in: high G+C Gram-positive bacteria)]